jgi:hypothetical protein
MNYVKTNPDYIDIWIQKMQVKLYEGLNFTNFNGYGRVYPIEKDKNIIPAYFISNIDYREVLTDDGTNGHFFCIESEESKMLDAHRIETPVDWIFFLNLKALFPNITGRADGEARRKITDEIQKVPFFKLEKIVIGLKAIEDFDVKVSDMQPWHIVSFQGKLKYQYNNC